MYFKRSVRIAYGLDRINIVPLINIVFLLLTFAILSFTLAPSLGIKVTLPKTVTSGAIKQEDLAITITGEDVMYFKGKAITIKKLRHELLRKTNRGHPILIKADRRASLGRVIDVWNLSRDLKISQINITTTQGE